MPTYEYVCTSCANQWEEIQKISEDPIEVCPSCHGSSAKRQISGGNFILKGGGWYADLYSSTPKKGDAKADGASGKSESATPKAETSTAPATSSGASAPASSGASSSSGSTGSTSK